MSADVIEKIKGLNLAFTITSGRSGTKLLTRILCDCLEVAAEHEPAPRTNYVMRSLLAAPSAAKGWLLTEKFPAMLASSRRNFYAETSHLVGKCLIDHILELGIRPRLILLSRPASEVAASLFAMNVIPGRTESGKLVLLSPDDETFLPISDWLRLTDYQLCYWYALETERRQKHYKDRADSIQMPTLSIQLSDLSVPGCLRTLSEFLQSGNVDVDAEIKFQRIISENQNKKEDIVGSENLRALPGDWKDQNEDLLSQIV